ncbi:hypothetical protein ABMA28_005776 [Loxostege sticticalis]|uniref:Odorant receptor n=1 Tax=Loxostege sticticalis TaxID=481309 RepID=A0ABD0SN01_LOXSC
MDFPTFEEAFRLTKINCWLLGIDGVNVHFRFYLIFATFFPVIFEELGFLITKASAANFVTLLGLIPCIIYCVVSVTKVVVVFLNRVKVVQLIKRVEQLYLKISKDAKKKEIVRHEIIFVKRLTKFLLVLNMTLVSVYNFSSLIIMPYHYITTNTVVYHLPYPVLVPFSTEACLPWFVVYIHSITCGYIAVIFSATMDALYYILVTHVCINFMVLHDDFLNLKFKNFVNLTECIQSHQHFIQLSEDLDVIFRLPNFINVLVGSIQICALGFCITVGDWSDMPGYFIFLSTVLVQLWMTSMFGEKILSSSSSISEAVWNCYWNCTDVKTQKTILLVLMRSQKPQKLTAYLFPVICISSFTKILSNAWSYFSILQSVYTPPA